MAADIEEETPKANTNGSPATTEEVAENGEQDLKEDKQPKEEDVPKAIAASQREVPLTATVEYDDFGLPIKRSGPIHYEAEQDDATQRVEEPAKETDVVNNGDPKQDAPQEVITQGASAESSGEEDFEDAVATPPPTDEKLEDTKPDAENATTETAIRKEDTNSAPSSEAARDPTPDVPVTEKDEASKDEPKLAEKAEDTTPHSVEEITTKIEVPKEDIKPTDLAEAGHRRDSLLSPTQTLNGVSEFSHQQITLPQKEKEDDDGEWQTMPAFAPYDIYDDDNKLIAREYNEEEEEEQKYSYAGMGGAGKGYTRVLVDDDAESVTSMDDNTNYLFKNAPGTSIVDDDDTRDAVSQMQATKDLLTEGQKIAYVGLTRLELSRMIKELETAPLTRATKKPLQLATEACKMWGQKIMIRIYTHMDISAAEQVMIEQLSEHGVISSDLTPQLMANARVKNPMADRKSSVGSRPASVSSPRPTSKGFSDSDEAPAEPPPAYDKHEGEELPAVRTPSQLPSTDKLDIDIRWTILCDLFLVLIADSIYDSRSRVLFERVGKALDIDWIDICRFERRVTEALEMQQQAERENWNEEEHMESRRKLALKKRYIVMGLATVGGGLVIGLSAGLLAPVIGAGLAAGFTTIGVTGTSSFLGGAAASAIITSGAAASGSVIGAKAANRRTGAVKTFEYRPLHNNKRVNLIVTISGWMTGKVDDVRLPFSTVDPMMGDIYSVLWEPEMLTSMGDTINILATEVSSILRKCP